jgi:DNA invertase Pin-like site-specific DNA recombinase
VPNRPTDRRCAVYTRKSSEEGLDQAFNSLDAQREACEAYARSQRHEGWALLPTLYDDGGISGGTMERPALQQLLADIRSGKVNLILVYKVDRLTRSLADFAKIVEVLDAHDASFVSVTQQFNTTTSMGRLTLNMLLSFAQFQREVAGERIRDKIAASKRKGMWMGGNVPFGYQVHDRKLVIEPEEAEGVRHIYRRYLALGTVQLLRQDLAHDGHTGKSGRPLTRGALFHLLRNRIYRGEIAHKAAIYPGAHEAIVTADLWDAVQARLAGNRQGNPTVPAHHPTLNLLSGLLHDDSGEAMTATHAVKGGKRYRYYVSRRLLTGTRDAHPTGLRLPAGDIERLVEEGMHRLLGDRSGLFKALRDADALPHAADAQQRMLQQAEHLAQHWDEMQRADLHRILATLLQHVMMHQDRVEVHLCRQALLTLLLGDAPAAGSVNPIGNTTSHDASPLMLTIPARLRRSGKEMVMVVEGPDAHRTPDPVLIKLLTKAHALRDALTASEVPSLTIFAEREQVSKSYVTRLVRLAYLAPPIVTAILEGRQPVGLSAKRLLQDTRLPLAWSEQQRWFDAF